MLQSYYSINMKKYTTPILPLLIAGLCLPAAAQTFKKALSTLPEAAQKATSQAGRAAAKRFYFPSYSAELNRELQASLAATAARANALNMSSITNIPPLPEMDYPIFAANMAEKDFLAIDRAERQFYQAEYKQAKEVLNNIKYLASYPSEPSAHDIAELSSQLGFIQNNFLRELVQNALADKDLNVLMLELAEYYTLDMTFEEAAFDYTLRHPHKRTLELRRLMLNPFIADQFKHPITELLSHPKIHPLEQEVFKQALTNLHQEYLRIVQESNKAPGVKTHLAYYDQIIDEIESFVARTGRLPKWNTNNPAEKDLFNRIEYLLSTGPEYSFSNLLTYYQEQLNMTLAIYATTHRSRQETLEAFDSFVKETGLLYPRVMADGVKLVEGEEALFDDLMYWRMKDESSVVSQIQDIQLKHSMPEDLIYK